MDETCALDWMINVLSRMLFPRQKKLKTDRRLQLEGDYGKRGIGRSLKVEVKEGKRCTEIAGSRNSSKDERESPDWNSMKVFLNKITIKNEALSSDGEWVGEIIIALLSP